VTSGILVVAEHRGGVVRDVTRELVTAARSLTEATGGGISVAVIADDPATLADQVDLAGVTEVLLVPVPGDGFSGDAHRNTVVALLRERAPSIVLGGFTVDGMNWGPAVAAAVGTGFASDVVAAAHEDDALVVRREFHGAKLHGELDFPGKETVLLLLRPTVWAAAADGGGALRTRVDIGAAPSRSTHREYEEAPIGDVDITTADFVLSIGRGIGERENIGLFEELSAKLGAMLASSRPLVDAGWMPAARQVGQSGNTVKPSVYLAFGISGAVQHLAGMKTAKTIIAINSDPEAPIFQIAHYGAIADIFEVAEALEELA
jgi:electron transfer flavoprotein alpha subunit